MKQNHHNEHDEFDKHAKTLGFTNWCIENRTTVYVIIILVTLGGYITYLGLPKESFPEIVVPQMVVTTFKNGTSPEDVENLITKPIEKELKTVKDVKKVTSTSIQDLSAVIVEFKTGVDVSDAKIRTQDAIDKSRTELPDQLDQEPTVQELDFSEFPVMQVNISGNYPLDKLKEYAEILQDDIEALPEVRRADLIGALEREIQINVDLYRMQAAGISFSNIEQAIKYENINASGGDLNVNDVRRTLRVVGEFKDMKSIENIIIRSATGNTVFLKEIASVADSYEERQDFARLEGKPVITLSVIKRSGENLIAASDKIQELVKKKEEGAFPKGVDITITGDQSDQTRTDLNDLINTIILGFIFVVLILMFFMGTTDAFFVALSVPLSALLAFLILSLLDYFLPSVSLTLNFMVMFAFLLGLGIVVDDAIVVIENTHRIFNLENIPIKVAAKKAAGEVFIPVLSGTLTTIAPFFPLLFWPGLIGEFMKFLPITLIVTLFASLIVAYVMNPVFAVTFMKKHDAEEPRSFRKLIKPLAILGVIAFIAYLIHVGFGNFMVFIMLLYVANYYVITPMINGFQTKVLPRFMKNYRGLIGYAITGSRPAFFLVGTFLLLVLSVVLTGITKPKVEFFPEGEPNFVYVYNQMPIGTDASVTDSLTKVITERVNKVIEPHRDIVTSVISNVGIGAGDPNNPDRTVAPHKSKVTIAFVKLDERLGVSTRKILEEVRKSVSDIAGTEISVEQESGGPPTGKPISIEIAGEEFDALLKIQSEIKNRIAKAGIQGIEELKSDLVLNKPEIVVDIDREKAAREGISSGQIAGEIRTALYGLEVSQYREAKDEYPIMVRLDTTNRRRIEDILGMNISYLDMATAKFRQVPLNSVASMRYGTSFSAINRKNQERLVTLSSNVLNGFNANDIVTQIQDQVVNQMELPAGYTIKMGGEQEDQQETAMFLISALASAVALIFLTLVMQFNSVSKPLIILITIVFSLIGVLLGFVVFDMTISILMTGVGIVALAGIVVKNGIILIEFTDELRARGEDLRTAVIHGGATRLTPVVLTASAAILGLIPLAIGMNINFASLFTHLDPEFFLGGGSSVFWGPLAWTIIFGLSFSTFLTLVIVPTMYWTSESLKLRIKKRRETKSEIIVPAE